MIVGVVCVAFATIVIIACTDQVPSENDGGADASDASALDVLGDTGDSALMADADANADADAAIDAGSGFASITSVEYGSTCAVCALMRDGRVACWGFSADGLTFPMRARSSLLSRCRESTPPCSSRWPTTRRARPFRTARYAVGARWGHRRRLAIHAHPHAPPGRRRRRAHQRPKGERRWAFHGSG
jgi:hypothetical protein